MNNISVITSTDHTKYNVDKCGVASYTATTAATMCMCECLLCATYSMIQRL